MADFVFKGTLMGHEAVGMTKDVKSGGVATIAIGDIVRDDDGNPGYVKKGANGDTDALTPLAYLAVSASDETASADGTVEVIYAPNMILQGTATTPGNLAQAVIDTTVTLDVTTGTQTIDENDTTNGFMRIMRPDGGGGNFDTSGGIIQVAVNE